MGGGSIHGSAFNPFANWGDKSAGQKLLALTGLPVGDNVGSPKWIKQHPKEAMLAAATAATVMSGGAAAGLLGGAGAAGAGAAGAGAEGAGLLGASGLAEMGTAGAATPGIGEYLAASSAPMFGADSTAGMVSGGGAADIAGAPQAANPFSIGMGNFNSQYGGMLKGGMRGLSMAQKVGLLGQPQRPPAPMPPRPAQQQPMPNTQLYQPQMPVELQALPPNDPQVIAWKKQNGIQV